jgi:hypothetical protein
MSIKLHKVIHCFDSLIILLYEHSFTIYVVWTFVYHLCWHPQMAWFECHRCLALQTRLLIKYTQPKHKFKNKILFNLTFIIILLMTHKNSILELILTDTNVLTEEHRYRTNAYQCTKKITRSMWRYLHKLSSASSTYGMLRPILVFPKKFSRKAANRPIIRKIR